MSYETKLQKLGYTLPPAPVLPDGVTMPFVPVRIVDDIAYISGQVPLTAEGRLQAHLGKVGESLSEVQAREAAVAACLGLLGALRREIGSLDRVESWISLLGMVNSAPGFTDFTSVINAASELLLEVFGAETGSHARSAFGVAGLPFDAPVEIEGRVKLKPA